MLGVENLLVGLDLSKLFGSPTCSTSSSLGETFLLVAIAWTSGAIFGCVTTALILSRRCRTTLFYLVTDQRATQNPTQPQRQLRYHWDQCITKREISVAVKDLQPGDTVRIEVTRGTSPEEEFVLVDSAASSSTTQEPPAPAQAEEFPIASQYPGEPLFWIPARRANFDKYHISLASYLPPPTYLHRWLSSSLG